MCSEMRVRSSFISCIHLPFISRSEWIKPFCPERASTCALVNPSSVDSVSRSCEPTESRRCRFRTGSSLAAEGPHAATAAAAPLLQSAGSCLTAGGGTVAGSVVFTAACRPEVSANANGPVDFGEAALSIDEEAGAPSATSGPIPSRPPDEKATCIGVPGERISSMQSKYSLIVSCCARLFATYFSTVALTSGTKLSSSRVGRRSSSSI
mmetsp:Transcript_76507/g.127516  ORF Transcript_76507/g.127516 Transcript_76507/m.127516 type:complete len:209 (-) Transcript_76507:699-1325(-)